MSVRTIITGLGQHGDGLAEVEGRQVFVPFALPGEEVEITLEGDRGHVERILTPSPDRIDPVSSYFGPCGGCSLQHLAPDAYATFKRHLDVNALRHTGIETPVSPLIDARGVGRRRATLHADRHSAGYMRARSHDLLDIESCAILVPALRQTAPRVGREIGALLGDCDVLFTATDTGIDVTVRTPKRMKPERLVPLAQRLRLTRLSLNGETIFQLAPPTLAVGRAQVDLPVGSFLQATAAAEETLARLVLAGVGKTKTVTDLFCGIGPFTLRLAERARVRAYDSDRPAIEALGKAVRFTQGLKPIAATVRDLFRDPLAPAELTGIDAVVFDRPARASAIP